MNARRLAWIKWVALAAAGGALFQSAACIENGVFVTSTASVVTAGGVLYILFRILND